MESGSDVNENDEMPGVSTPKKKRLSRGDLVEKQKHRQQKYKPDWEKDPIFTKWLTQDPKNVYKARCKVCDASIVAEKHIITKHSESQKHIKNVSVIRGTQNVSSFFAANTSSKQEPSTTKLARIAEIKLAACFAEHNIAFNVSDHLGKVLKGCIPDSKVIKEMHFTRKKNAKIVYKAIGPSHKANLAKKLETSKFSVMTDESTDISTNKASCIVVRYFDEDVGKIRSTFWNLHNIFSGENPNEANEGATANNIYSKLIESFTKHNIPLKNIVGFGSDGCNVMMGSENSVASRFKEECPGIIIMKCTCHSIHLCASAACQKLPNRCEELARGIFRFLKMSSKRSAQLIQFQTFLEVKPQKMLHPSQTRWLSLVQVVKRILDHWEALKLYFTDMAISERLITGQIIVDLLRDPYMKLYYEFMTWALPKFTNLNLHFQSQEVVVTELAHKIKELYKDFLFCFMQRNYVNRTEICDINPADTAWQLPDEQIYLGIAVASKIDTPEIKADMVKRKEFISRCKDFLVESAQQIRKRYDFNSKPLLLISILSPVKALSQRERETTPSILPIASAFPRVTDITNIDHIQLLDDQWRALGSAILPDEINSEQKTDVFWNKLYQWHDLTDHRPFQELSKFALDCLILPHANADCERIFSKVNLTKTKIRNKLATQSIDAILLSCDAIKEGRKSGNCTDFIPTEDMLTRLNSHQVETPIQELINIEDDLS